MVERVDDVVHAVGDEGHDDAEHAQEDPVLHLAQALAPDEAQELGGAPVEGGPTGYYTGSMLFDSRVSCSKARE